MRCIKLHVVAAMVALAAAASQAAAQNLLTDGGFEDATKFTSDGAPFVGFWEAFNGGPGASSVRDNLMPRSGAANAHVAINNVNNTFAGLFQDVPGLIPGQSVAYSGWNKGTPLPFGPGVEYRIEWRNSVSNTEISRTSNLDPGVTADYTKFSRTEVVPAGVDTARAVYAIQTFGGTTDTGDIFLDDFSVRVVPEPASLALLGLAGAALVGMRRRMA